MRKLNLYKIVIFSSILILVFGCHKRDYMFSYISDENIRVAGPEGKTIIFLNNYSDDFLSDTLLVLDIPEGALDCTIIFNFYQFNDQVLNLDLQNELGKFPLSNFIYLTPVFEHDSFYEPYYLDSSYCATTHNVLDFNKSVTVSYYDYTYDIYPNTKLYRIKIPRDNEWGTNYNISACYSNDGYPIGYYEPDLTYLINGKWNSNSPYGTGGYNLANWEEVTNYSIDTAANSVTFSILSLDYMYVLIE
ncbi:MAG: hypothetical protein K9J13_13390 [Saprospiraceae bacterium]|nr:hypothetical protein [Saprospiraceae bacterium]